MISEQQNGNFDLRHFIGKGAETPYFMFNREERHVAAILPPRFNLSRGSARRLRPRDPRHMHPRPVEPFNRRPTGISPLVSLMNLRSRGAGLGPAASAVWAIVPCDPALDQTWWQLSGFIRSRAL
jgi:hypothetical protein